MPATPLIFEIFLWITRYVINSSRKFELSCNKNKLCERPPQYAPAPCKLTFDLLTLKVVSESRVTWATSVPILVFLGLSVLDLSPMYATDRQTSDARHRLMPLPHHRVEHNNRSYWPKSDHLVMSLPTVVTAHASWRDLRRRVRVTEITTGLTINAPATTTIRLRFDGHSTRVRLLITGRNVGRRVVVARWNCSQIAVES